MKIVVTGSLGNINKSLVPDLLAQGHEVTVISSSTDRTKEIEVIGAKPAIGTIKDKTFLVNTFEGQDAVYCMLPPFRFFEVSGLNYKEEALTIATNYAYAIQKTGIKKVVHLSSAGAEKENGTGLLVFHNIVETVLRKLPDAISVTHIRPVSFDYNVYSFMDMIQGTGFLEGFVGKLIYLQHYGIRGLLKGYKGIILSNYGADDKIAWVSPKDIAAAVANELTSGLPGRSVSYVASEELTCQEVASIIGNAIGKPYLKWVIISNKQMKKALEQIGASKQIAAELTEMNSKMHDGSIFEDYYKNRPRVFGKVKMTEFAHEFARRFNSKQ